MGFPAGPDDLCAPLLRHLAPRQGAGLLPEGSTVRAARWCVSVFPSTEPRVQLRQASGDLAALDRALHAPRAVPLPTGVACTAVGHAVFTLEVLDQHGRVHRPTLPTSPCGDPSGTRDALAATAYTVVSSVPPTAR